MICARLHDLDLNPAVGITTGVAFCGLVGAMSRREYSVLGAVNVACHMLVDDSKDVQIVALQVIGKILLIWNLGISADYVQLKTLLKLLHSSDKDIKNCASQIMEKYTFSDPRDLHSPIADLLSILSPKYSDLNQELLHILKCIAWNNKRLHCQLTPRKFATLFVESFLEREAIWT